MRKSLLVVFLILIIILTAVFIINYNNKKLLNEINSLGSGNFVFANNQSFFNYNNKALYIYRISNEPTKIKEYKDYSIVVLSIRGGNDSNVFGLENLVNHLNISLITWCAYEFIHGDKELSYEVILRLDEALSGWLQKNTESPGTPYYKFIIEAKRYMKDQNANIDFIKHLSLQYQPRKQLYENKILYLDSKVIGDE